MKYLFTIFLAQTALLNSCGDSDLENQELGSDTAATPNNLDVSVRCALENDPLAQSDSELKFRGKSIKYFDSIEIPYQNEEWWKRDKAWVSFSGLDSALLGFPGFDGSAKGRDFSISEPVNARVVAIDIRKINGKLKYHYFSNETADSPMENWSSTKSLAMLMAAHSIRAQSGFSHGMNSVIASTQAPLAAAVTDVADTSNNRTAAWLKSFVGAQGADHFAKNWLGGATRTAFGGSHGEAPQPWGNKLLSQGVVKTFAGAGTFNSISNNTLMPILMAEFWKRIGVNLLDARTLPKKTVSYTAAPMSEAQRIAALDATESGITEQDLAVLLYGAPTGARFGGLLLGGAQSDRFVDALGGKSNLDAKFGGKWRFYGKTGTGAAVRSGRSRNEQIIGGFVCLPANPQNAVLKHGRAFAFFINIQAAGDTSGPRAATLGALSRAFVPEVHGKPNLWSE